MCVGLYFAPPWTWPPAYISWERSAPRPCGVPRQVGDLCTFLGRVGPQTFLLALSFPLVPLSASVGPGQPDPGPAEKRRGEDWGVQGTVKQGL